MTAFLSTLTDFEVAGLSTTFCLADGHAYHDLPPSFQPIVDNLPAIWKDAARHSIPEAEKLFNLSYASFIQADSLKEYPHFRICPTASNSIDIIGTVLKALNYNAILIEPTFDNLALVVKRRGVPLDSIADVDLFTAAESNEIEQRFPELKKYNALFIVHPNNPTGLTLTEAGFKNIVAFCCKHNILMVVDNCFRVYRNNLFSDYHILFESGVRFMAFEDTGKVWPTQDLKASLIYFSKDLAPLFNEIYNEVYLCVSNFALGILSSFFDITRAEGRDKTILNIVNSRRQLVREAIHGTKLSVPNIAQASMLPVEWLVYNGTDKNDFDLCSELKNHHLAVLPGRQFYWNSTDDPQHQKNIRVSLMKRESVFTTGLTILQKYAQEISGTTFQRAA